MSATGGLQCFLLLQLDDLHAFASRFSQGQVVYGMYALIRWELIRLTLATL